MTIRACIIAAVAASAVCGNPAIAQGAQSASAPFTTRYDAAAPLEVTGKIKRLDWGMPNVWIFLEVPDTDAAGKAKSTSTVFGFSAGTPDGISQTELNLTNETRAITIRGYRSNEACGTHPDLGPACKGIARTVTMPNGCTVFVGASGIGAPRDGLDPSEGGKPATCKPG